MPFHWFLWFLGFYWERIFLLFCFFSSFYLLFSLIEMNLESCNCRISNHWLLCLSLTDCHIYIFFYVVADSIWYQFCFTEINSKRLYIDVWYFCYRIEYTDATDRSEIIWKSNPHKMENVFDTDKALPWFVFLSSL